MIPVPHSKPWLPESCLSAMAAPLRSGMIGQGTRTVEFERAASAWVSAAGGVAVGSGSAAVYLALAALGIGRGSEVILPTYVCPAVMEAVVTSGARPILCDVGPDWVMTAENAAGFVSTRTRAIVVPHIYGVFADVASFRAFGVPLIEDCAQAVDAEGARPIAGDILVFSFHPTKCLTTGEGGMAVTNHPELLEAMRALRDGVPGGDRPRVFSPLPDVSAALGLAQLEIYPAALERRRHIAAAYRKALEPLVPEALPPKRPGKGTMYFRFPLRVRGGCGAYAEAFEKHGVLVRSGVDRLLHRLAGLDDRNFPVATELFNSTLSLPIYPALTDAELDRCITAAHRVLPAGASG